MSYLTDSLTVDQLTELQVAIENAAVHAGVARYQEVAAKRDLTDMPAGQLVVRKTTEHIALAISTYLEDISSGKANRGASKLKFLRMLDPVTLAFITLTTLLNGTPEKLGTLANRLGRRIEDELNALALANGKDENGESLRGLFQFIVEKLAADGSRHFKRKAIEWQKNKHAIQSIADELGWDDEAKATMGLTLIYIVLENTDLFALDSESTTFGGSYKLTHIVRPTAQLLVFLEKTDQACSFLRPVYPPMVRPPVPWKLELQAQEDGSFSVVSSGGYVSRRLKVDLIKGANPNYMAEAVESGQLTPVLEAVNYLQNTAWRINPDVARVALEVWDRDLGVALPVRAPVSLPARSGAFEDAFSRVAPAFTAWAKLTRAELRGKGLTRGQKYDLFLQAHPEFSADLAVVRAWKREAAQVHETNSSAERIGAIKDADMKLRMVREYLGYEAIWFPYQLDFRGRAYPVTNFLNPQGDSFCKGVLSFAHGVPLTDSSAQWLAIHGANCWANDKIDKAPFADRIQWVKDNEGNILRSAADPLGCQWWTEADGGDNAWLFLAFCFEWARWVEGGEGTLSYLPVSADGSCNGIQHYAALLRSSEDGAAVNLTPSEQPQDIYTRVADYTLKVVTEDVADEEKSRFAQLFHPLLSNKKKARSLVKRATMTTPYSVTKFGIKDQLRTDNKDLFSVDKNTRVSGLGLDKQETKQARAYLADAIDRGIQHAVAAATKGMAFLKDVASAAAKEGLPLVWTTPDGFVVQQRYEKFDLVQVKTVFAGNLKLKKSAQIAALTDVNQETEVITAKNLEVPAVKRTVSVSLAKPLGILNTRKQASAVGPNYIHSLDAAHLRATLRRCQAEGIPAFAAVHDSFGVHAAHYETMSRVLREEFVAMHGADLLARFLGEVRAMPGIDPMTLPKAPAHGDLQLEGVLQSDYFFA